MNISEKRSSVDTAAFLRGRAALAKLPALSDDADAKAAEAAVKADTQVAAAVAPTAKKF